ncbi:MAG: methylated-DNA--[protein]-cysteine S-methyltransferase [Desulfobacterota bacterium]|nr:methylated-DNA--[protein]-cysteine S-methyltransferase [Thermodesulfobacteriota bacterium]MDW8002225.1 methylated-DNA--[protein]-cysteine S-methyltransferase [Deltaproteobacteria bacterium]
MVISYAIYPTSLCNIALLAMDGKLFELRLVEEEEMVIKKLILSRFPDAYEDEAQFKVLRILLERYFRGENVGFDVDVVFPSSTPFEKKVFLETRTIPYGETRTYGWLAEKIGYRNASRAVGQALRRNPIPLIIPCHRVIQKDGRLGGFSCGVHIKRRLLELEGIKLEK